MEDLQVQKEGVCRQFEGADGQSRRLRAPSRHARGAVSSAASEVEMRALGGECRVTTTRWRGHRHERRRRGRKARGWRLGAERGTVVQPGGGDGRVRLGEMGMGGDGRDERER